MIDRLGIRVSSFFLFLSMGAAWGQQAFVPQVIATPGAPSAVLYGLYRGSVVKSADLGSTWNPIYITTPGLPQPPVQGFDIDQLNPSTVYFATSAAVGAFWKSTDGGATWAKANTGLPSLGATVDSFKQILDTANQVTLLYVKIGDTLYKSANQGASWSFVGYLPGSTGRIAIAGSRQSWMYYIDPEIVQVWFSGDEGHSWSPIGTVPAMFPAHIIGMDVLYFNPSALLVSLDSEDGSDQGSWISTTGGVSFQNGQSVGLGSFSNLFSYTYGPAYASTPTLMGGYRSTDSGQSWQPIGINGDHFTVTAVDPGVRTTVYGLKIPLGGTAATTLVTSGDSGNTWTPISSTITPTISQPAVSYNVTLEQGALYSVSFTVQTLEDPTWRTPVTVATSGEPWIQLAAASGSTPLANSLTISSAGLAPGTYTSTIRISAPQSANKSVSIPVQLTVKPLGSIGPGYLVSTIAGNGNAGGGQTSGPATSLAIGSAKALGFDGSGNLTISAGSRIWQLNSGNLTALAGNGTNGSNGDGADPLSASISDPDAIALDSAGTVYFTEYATQRVRKVANGSISTPLDMNRPGVNQTGVTLTVGSHSLLFDSVNRMLLTGPPGLLRYDFSRLTIATRYSFTDPYGTVADASGNLYISDRAAHQIFKLTPAGVVTAIAGTGIAGFSGDGGPASQAQLNSPMGLAIDSVGVLYIADSVNHRIRTITTDGNIHTIAGSGVSGFAGDGQTGDFASFMNPSAVAVDPNGNVYVADSGNNRVRKLVTQGTATPVISKIQGPSYAVKLSPGSLFSLYGDQFVAAGVAQQASSTPWQTSMAGVSISINGHLAPLYYVSKTQINGQIPFEVTTGTATLSIVSNGSAAVQTTFPVVPAEPDILVQGGGTQALAVNLNGTVNTPSAPAHAGDIEVLYLSGIGIPTLPVATGAASPSLAPFALANYPYSITLGAKTTTVYFLGYAPGFPALVQANFQIPTDLAPGDYQVVVTVNGESSSSIPTQISVR